MNGKDVGDGCGLFEGSVMGFPWRDRGKS